MIDSNEFALKGEEDKKVLLSSAAERWLEEIRASVKVSTYSQYFSKVHKYLIPDLGHFAVEEMTTKDLEEYFCSLMKKSGSSGHPLSPKTVSDLRAILRSILFYSAELGCRLQVRIDRIRIPVSQKQMRVLSRDEQKRLVQYLKEQEDRTSLGILLTMQTGIRLGELCALQRQDFSFEKHVMHIRKTRIRVKNFQKEGPKTILITEDPKSICSNRTIPLPDELCAALFQKVCKDDMEDYFLTGSQTGPDPRTMENRFMRVMKQLEIEGLTFHGLRHTFATEGAEIISDVKVLSELLGHSSVSLTLNRYVHPSMETKKKYMELMEHRLD